MATIGFIGLGNMGAPMAANLVKAGHQVTGFDLVTGRAARKGALLIDCSTIDVETARAVAAAAADARVDMLDAPVSGGVVGAETASLTIIVGGNVEAFERGRPLLAAMGRTIVHTGPSGNGQAAKICNNMILGASMIVVCKAFSLAERLGLAAQTLFDISARSSGQCWALTSYCPVPGPVPASPANRDYVAGFAAAMMLKDLRLAQQAAGASAAATPLGSVAASLYQLFVDEGMGGLDFSGIYRFIRNPAASVAAIGNLHAFKRAAATPPRSKATEPGSTSTVAIKIARTCEPVRVTVGSNSAGGFTTRADSSRISPRILSA